MGLTQKEVEILQRLIVSEQIMMPDDIKVRYIDANNPLEYTLDELDVLYFKLDELLRTGEDKRMTICHWCGKDSVSGAQALNICSWCKKDMSKCGGGGDGSKVRSVYNLPEDGVFGGIVVGAGGGVNSKTPPVGSGGGSQSICGICSNPLTKVTTEGCVQIYCSHCKIGSGGGWKNPPVTDDSSGSIKVKRFGDYKGHPMKKEEFQLMAEAITEKLKGKVIECATVHEWGMGHSIWLHFRDKTMVEIRPEYDEGFIFELEDV